MAGSVWNGNFAVAKYWKNGIRVNLGSETSTSYAMAIAVSGSDSHVVGWGGDNLGPKYAKYWKNGVEVPLTDFSEDYSEATDVAVSGSDVYIVGRVRKE